MKVRTSGLDGLHCPFRSGGLGLTRAFADEEFAAVAVAPAPQSAKPPSCTVVPPGFTMVGSSGEGLTLSRNSDGATFLYAFNPGVSACELYPLTPAPAPIAPAPVPVMSPSPSPFTPIKTGVVTGSSEWATARPVQVSAPIAFEPAPTGIKTGVITGDPTRVTTGPVQTSAPITGATSGATGSGSTGSTGSPTPASPGGVTIGGGGAPVLQSEPVGNVNGIPVYRGDDGGTYFANGTPVGGFVPNAAEEKSSSAFPWALALGAAALFLGS